MRNILIVALVAGVTACVPIQVKTDWNPDAVSAMEQYRTYSWIPQPKPSVKEGPAYNTMLGQRVKAAVEQCLLERGYVEAPGSKKADFGLAWQGTKDKKLSLQTVNSYYGYGYRGWYGPAGGWYSDTYVSEYEVGTLIIDVVDLGTNELVWRGIAQSELMNYSDPEKRQARLQKAVDKLLAEFPP